MERNHGQAIPLILFQEREGFRLTSEGLNFLNSIKTKVSVVAVAGKYRTGKSYMLNKIILDVEGPGFGVGPTINPCTKGLWIWSEPIPVKAVDGQDVSLLVIDSEGLGAFDEDANHDTRIFMLSVLLSSYFIYNSVGSIDENALTNLSLIVNLTKSLQIRASDSGLDVDEVSAYFPSFLWVLRDFALQLIDPAGNPITSKEYLENSLQLQKGVSDAIEAKNRVRKLLKHFFRDRDCFTLVRPSEDERVLQELDKVPDSALRPEFVREKQNLKKLIYRRVKVKSFNSKDLTGELLAGLAQSYVDAINRGAVPTIEGAWQAVCNSECQKQVENAIQEYEDMFKEEILTEEIKNPSQLKALHKQCKTRAMKMLKEKAIGDDTSAFEAALKKKLLEKFNYYNSQNERKLADKCENICNDLTIEMQDKLKRNEYTDFQVFKRDFEKKLSEIKKSGPQGVAAELKMKEISAHLLTEAAEYINRNAMIEHENANRKISSQLEFFKTAFDAKKEEFGKEKEYYKTRLQEVESENYKLKASQTALELKVEQLKEDKERMENKYEKRLGELKSDHKEQSGEWKAKYEETLKLYNELQIKYNTDINQLEKELALAKQELAWKSRENADLKEKREDFDMAFREMKANLRNAIEQNELKDKELQKLKENPVKVQEISLPNEWNDEKNVMKLQIENLQKQIEDNKRFQENLIMAMQSKSPQVTQPTEENDERYQRLEEQIEQLKNMQNIVNSSSALQCRYCEETISSKLFNAHITVCAKNYEEGILKEQGLYSIVVSQSMVKDPVDQKPFTEYVITITYKGQTWTITKRYKALCNLHSSLQREFPDVQLPNTDNLFLNNNSSSLFNTKRPVVLNERRRACQQYLMDLAAIPIIRNSQIFKDFLSVTQNFGDESPVKSQRGNVLNSLRKSADLMGFRDFGSPEDRYR
ncbi:unnamed protein product [Blepharisma stoltei]|uniref:Guanylate-binding protein n=1 Tax=Blepharisma stoltei TaxID=1481888 RepID=A0AAU9IYN7_9CILI|nr:unnamed protein product [Blepharisma stoltei]